MAIGIHQQLAASWRAPLYSQNPKNILPSPYGIHSHPASSFQNLMLMKNNYMFTLARVSKRVLTTSFLLLLFSIHFTASAQTPPTINDMMVTGQVVDSNDSAPMYGVNVQLKGTMDGAATDDSGRFIFPRNLKVGDVLVFSFIGYYPQEYAISEKDRNSEVRISLVFGMDILGAAAEDGVYEKKRGIRQWFKKGGK
jgi:hypothetical protein